MAPGATLFTLQAAISSLQNKKVLTSAALGCFLITCHIFSLFRFQNVTIQESAACAAVSFLVTAVCEPIVRWHGPRHADVTGTAGRLCDHATDWRSSTLALIGGRSHWEWNFPTASVYCTQQRVVPLLVSTTNTMCSEFTSFQIPFFFLSTSSPTLISPFASVLYLWGVSNAVGCFCLFAGCALLCMLLHYSHLHGAHWASSVRTLAPICFPN